MRNKPLTLALAPVLLALAWPALAGGKAEVSFEKPESFRDLGMNPRDRDDALKSLSAYLEKLAARLPDGQVLQVELTDIDLAGEERPMALREVRVMRGTADWPTIDLRYTLREGSRTLKAGAERLSDMSYLLVRTPIDLQQDTQPYEKRMLRKWFEQNFIATP